MIFQKYKASRKLSALFMTLALVAVAYCGDPVPVKEMGDAKLSIAKAESMNADQYAKTQIDGARSSLLQSHEYVAKEDMGKAKELAEKARVFADQAFDIAAPLHAKETRNQAEKAIAEAEMRYAEEFASEEFKQAKAELAEGDNDNSAKRYVEAFQHYETSREQGLKARNISESQAEIMKRDVAEIEDALAEAAKYGARESSASEYNSAKENARKARENIAKMNLKEAYPQIQEGKKQARSVLASSQKGWAMAKNQEAKTKVAEAKSKFEELKKQLENEKTKKIFGDSVEAQDALKATEDSLNAASDSLQSSNNALQSGAYQDAYNQAEEAIRLAKIVEEQVPQVMVLVAEAEKRSLKETTTTTTANTTIAKGWKKYKVRLIPQRRDCLWRIASYKFIYRNARLWPRIYRANKNQIKNPDLIYPGQVFDIPPKRGSTKKPAKMTTTTEEGNTSSSTEEDDNSTMSSDEDTTATDDTSNAQ